MIWLYICISTSNFEQSFLKNFVLMKYFLTCYYLMLKLRHSVFFMVCGHNLLKKECYYKMVYPVTSSLIKSRLNSQNKLFCSN